MKKTFLIITALCFGWILQAKIVYIDFVQDSVVRMDNFLDRDRVPIILGYNNVAHFSFRYDDWRKPPQTGTEWFVHLSSLTLNGEMVLKGTAVNPYGGRYLDPLTKGTMINSNANWGNSNPEPFVGDSHDPNFMGLGDRYAGIRFETNGLTYYGWILLSLDNNQTLTVKSMAYENVFNTPIAAGDTSGGPAPILVNDISVYGINAQFIPLPGAQLQMVADVKPVSASNQALTWSVTNLTGKASIDSEGLLTGLWPGTVSVMAKANDGSNISGDTIITIFGSVTLVDSILVSGQNGQNIISTPLGALQMFADVFPRNSLDPTVTWSVLNGTGKASINSSGLVTALRNGKVTIVATANDGSGVTGSADLTLSNQPLYVSSISISAVTGGKTITDPGGTLQMRAIILPVLASDKAVTWQVENRNGRASISSTGLVQAIADGKVRITAHATDGSGVYSTPFEINIYNQALSNDERIETALSLSPNPVQNTLHIHAEKLLSGVEILLPNGQLVKKVTAERSKIRIDLSGFPRGLYYVRITDVDGYYTVKPISKF